MEIHESCSPNLSVNMTLDNFFTLTEMNNGLTAPSRVRELMDVIQKERNCIVKNDTDLSRQWSAVARAISATENKDCLDSFVQLDGLKFISKWLKDAQKVSNNAVDSFVEESISQLLQVLETLIVDHENLFGSEIWSTIRDCLVLNSSKVQVKAQELFDRRAKNGDGDVCLPDVEKSRTSTNDEAVKVAETSREIDCSKSSLGDTSISRENSAKEKSHDLTRDELLLSSTTGTIRVEGVDRSEEKLDPPIGDRRRLDHVGSSSLAKSTMELGHSSGAASEPCNPAVSAAIVTLSTHLKPNDSESASCTKQSPKVESLPEKVQSTEEFKMTEDDEPVGSNSDAVDEMKPLLVVSSCTNSLARDRSLCGEGSSNTHSRTIDSDGKGADKKSDMDIDYGIIDPLEVARQVAMEVEREIVDSREQSCSSSERLPEDNLQAPSSPDSAGGKILSHSSEGSPNTLSDDLNMSDESSPMQQDSAISSENLSGEQANGTQDMAIAHVSEVAQHKADMEKGMLDFDLNQEICPEDADLPGNKFSTPISIASASRAAPALGLRCAPLQFEGNLGWKGSAATSAFHSASPNQIPEIDMHPSTVGSSTVSKLRQGYLDIDLNAAESVVTGTADALPDKEVQVFSTQPSEESSVEMNSRRSELLELDLNRASEDCAPSDQLTGQCFPQGNSGHSNSYSFQNIDLNHQPSLPNDSPNNYSFSMASQNFNASAGISSDNSIISIMGTSVQVNQKDFVSQDPSLPNGRAPELAFDINLGMTGSLFAIGSLLPYTHSSVYGYNNISHAATIPFSAIQGSGGPIPYMVDSRGAPVIPQVMAPATTSSQPPPFAINSLTLPEGIDPLQTGFDLNSRMLVERGSEDPAALGLFLNSTQVTSVNDQPRYSSNPSLSLTVGGKRKEPEDGFRYYPFEQYVPSRKQN